MQIANRMVDSVTSDDNLIDQYYEKLKCNIIPIEKGSEIFKLIEMYVLNTHNKKHCDYDL